ncbi:MarR family winged helix-turn-helix transcriptional regulator [Cellulomonas edaphi]|uniref:MarR family winged helix-turn-helix transcriptional regulator n=1 Tax=Cellulomonas edaphi TaxID=3053468 RepID=A0ABT7S9G2_9CELL|nr:MarR family winged helix-turn-helix transcriptional regulator [Cellulomons edaphi]MDM7832240.1 MarR family winged helix-turn-helix transcriptional regulator [Cellulomons edaphi]
MGTTPTLGALDPVTESTPAAGATEATPEPGPQPVQWLTEQEQKDWRAYRDATIRLFDVIAHELDASSGLSAHEYEVLVRLSEAPDRTQRMSGLADDLAHSRSRLTHTVRRMEERGLVVRSACSADARGVECTMTELGWTTLVAAAPPHVQSVRDHLVDVLTPEQFRALGDAMQTVRDHLVSGPCHAANLD